MTSHVLVTGAEGFLDRHLVRHLVAQGNRVTAVCRRPMDTLPQGAVAWVLADLCLLDDRAVDRLRGVECVIHCAGRVHMLKYTADNPLEEFRKANVKATLTLAERAAAAGVPKFIFISSIGVNGASSGRRAFRPDDTPQPATDYSVSKWEVEQSLDALSKRTGMQVFKIRAPMIYGRNAPGNFALLTKAVRSGLPLPFGAMHEMRSFVSLDNMADLLSHVAANSKVNGGTYLVSDGQDLSTTEFIRDMARAMGRRAMLFPVPVGWLATMASLFGRADQVGKMAVPLTMDITRTCQDLGWIPHWSVQRSMDRALGALDETTVLS